MTFTPKPSGGGGGGDSQRQCQTHKSKSSHQQISRPENRKLVRNVEGYFQESPDDGGAPNQRL